STIFLCILLRKEVCKLPFIQTFKSPAEDLKELRNAALFNINHFFVYFAAQGSLQTSIYPNFQVSYGRLKRAELYPKFKNILTLYLVYHV
ncbi:hypothetical protein, partial [uncultured Microscilla sp.]|uniref:hypothetical protein n=1 Tax=uncultured Microscilla sp. TaxID=432653 RepID=UPI00261F478C